MVPQDDGEMRFSLPAAPSPAVLLALLAACRELERAGAEHTRAAVSLQPHFRCSL